MASEDPKGFKVDLNALEDIATKFLPQAVEALRGPIKVITSHEGLEGPGRLREVFTMEDEYAAFADGIGNQQRIGCERVEATIEAFKQIVELYRRVDGQR